MSKKEAGNGGVFHQGEPEGYLSISQAQAACECSQATVWRWVRHKLVKAVRYRNRVYVYQEDLRRLDAVRPYRRQPGKNSYTSLLRTGATKLNGSVSR